MFTLQDSLPMHPLAIGGACWLCGAGQRHIFDPAIGHERAEVYVNPSRDIDFEGGVFFCESCVTEMGRLVGLVSPHDVDAAQAERDAAFEMAATAELRRDEAEAMALSLLTLAQRQPFVPEVVDVTEQAKPATKPRKAAAKA